MRLVILDRDGVINHDSDDYIKSPAEWTPIPGSLEAIARLNQSGCRVVVATNQSGVARGLFTMASLIAIHDKMNKALAHAGANVEAIFFCPHAPEDHCACRKPQPGLFRDIAARLNVDLSHVPAIGDALRDVQAAQAAGARPLLVRTGKGAATVLAMQQAPIPGWEQVTIYDDLAAAVDGLLATPISGWG